MPCECGDEHQPERPTFPPLPSSPPLTSIPFPTLFCLLQSGRELADILARCRKGLGLDPAADVAARLHKLLLYEKGGHFSPHRDSEGKAPGQFATLVICLPSNFQVRSV